MLWEVEGLRQRGRPKKTWWDCVKNDMESLVMSQKERMHSSGLNGEGELRGNRLTQVHLEKWLLKWSVCVFVTCSHVHFVSYYKLQCSSI